MLRYKRISSVCIVFLLAGFVHAGETVLNNHKSPVTWSEELMLQEPVFDKNSNISMLTSPYFSLNQKTVSYSGFVIPPLETDHFVLLFDADEIKRKSVESLYETYGFNRAVKNRIHYYSKQYKHDFLKKLRRAGKYLEPMAEIFREKNLPQELVFLPLVESGFRLMAYSHKRAAGPWQFIPSTARRFGLKIDWWIDERRDPIKSTRAAAEYLQDLYEMFGSWNLALAAYNAGERRIQRALKRAKSNDFWVLRRTRYIRRETKNYVPSYIAAAAIAIHPERFGLERVTYNTPLMYDEVTMYSPIDLSLVAEFTGVKTTDIKILNPELRRWCTPPNVSSYTLRIPRGTREQFIANLSNAREDELLYVELYTVKKGDTVWDLSKRFGVPSQAIIDLNYLNKRALIIAGKKIVFPSIRTSDDGSKHMRLRPILKKNPKSKTSL